MKRITLLIIILSIITAAAWRLFPERPKTPRPATQQNRWAGYVPGSYRALTQWNNQRAYPNQLIPQSGFSDAWQWSQKRLQPAERLQKNTTPWQPIGPTNWAGRTMALAIHPDNPERLFAGSASGGLWVSENGGSGQNAWQRVDMGFPVLGVAAIAIDPNNSQVMYVGTGEVYGFQRAAPGVSDRTTRGSYGVGILKSEDGGQTWRHSLDWRANQQHGVQAIQFDPANSNKVWAATTLGVYTSNDAGQSWTQMLDVVMATDIRLHPEEPNRILVTCGGLGSEGHGIYLSEDGGANWSKKTEGLPESFQGKANFGTTPSNPNLVYASIGNGYQVVGNTDLTTWLTRSNDFGRTWQIVSADNSYAEYQGWYSHYVAIDPRDDNHLYIGGLAFNQSFDAGAEIQYTVLNVTAGAESYYGSADHHAFLVHPSDPKTYYFACDQGIIRTTDGGRTYEACNSGYQTGQFYNGMSKPESLDDHLVGSVQDGSAFLWEGAPAWRYAGGHEGGWSAFDPNDPGVLYLGAAHGIGMTRTLNGIGGDVDITPPCPTGDDPQSQDCFSRHNFDATSFSSPFVVSPSDPNVLYYGRSHILKSVNRGDSWAVMNGGEMLDGNPAQVMAISRQDADTVYVATAPRHTTPGVYVTRDGGVSWLNIGANLPDRYPSDIVVDPMDDGTAYISYSGFGSSHLFRTTDYGGTWLDLDRGGLPDVPTNAIALDSERPGHIYLGNDLGVYVTSNGGVTWQSWVEGLPNTVLSMDLVIDLERRMLYLGTHGNGAYGRPLLDDVAAPTTMPYVYTFPNVKLGEDVRVELVLQNPDLEVQAEFELLAFNDHGTLLGSAQNYGGTLEPGGHLSVSVAAFFSAFADDVDWVMVGSSKPLHVFSKRRAPETESAAPAVVESSVRAYLPHVAKNSALFKTEVSVVNAGPSEGDITLRTMPGSVSRDLTDVNQGYARESYDLTDLLGEDLASVDWAVLESEGSRLMADERFSRLPGEDAEAALSLSNQTGKTLRFLHIAKDTALFWTGLVYINVSETDTMAEEVFYDDLGNETGRRQVMIAAAEKRVLLHDQATEGTPEAQVPSGSTWMRVSADQELVGYELFGSNVKLPDRTFAGLYANFELSAVWDLAHFEAGFGRWTGLVVLNDGDTAVSVTFTLYDLSGEALESKTVENLEPNAKLTVLANDFFDAANHGGGRWVRVEADAPTVAAFQLWGDHETANRKYLSGITGFKVQTTDE